MAMTFYVLLLNFRVLGPIIIIMKLLESEDKNVKSFPSLVLGQWDKIGHIYFKVNF